MKKIIITGGTGYIGSHTVVEFINAGYEPIIIDNLSNSNINVLDGIEKITGKRPAFYKADVTDSFAMDKIFYENDDAVAVVHFAASKAVGESVQKPLLYYRNNLNGLINVLEMMEKHGVKGLVFSSSCTVYGQPEKLPVTEETPFAKAESPYGNTKKISEEIIQDTLRAVPTLKAIALRYFNPIGAHPSAQIGELPNGTPNNLMPYITQTAMSAGGPIVDPKVGGFIIIPICPYKLGARPFIVSDNSEITVKLLKKGKSAVFVMDGQLNEEARYEEEIKFKKSDKDVYFIRTSSKYFYKKVKEKLNEGGINNGTCQ